MHDTAVHVSAPVPSTCCIHSGLHVAAPLETRPSLYVMGATCRCHLTVTDQQRLHAPRHCILFVSPELSVGPLRSDGDSWPFSYRSRLALNEDAARPANSRPNRHLVLCRRARNLTIGRCSAVPHIVIHYFTYVVRVITGDVSSSCQARVPTNTQNQEPRGSDVQLYRNSASLTARTEFSLLYVARLVFGKRACAGMEYFPPRGCQSQAAIMSWAIVSFT